MSDTEKVPNALESDGLTACQVVCAVLGCGAFEAEQILVGLQVDEGLEVQLQLLHSVGDVDAIKSILFPPKEEPQEGPQA